MKHIFAGLVLIALLVVTATAAAADSTPIDFQDFAGTGFAPEPGAGQLDSDLWRVTGLSDGTGTFGGTYVAGDFARGISGGGAGTGGIYAFETGDGNRILGVQPTDADFTPGELTLRVYNTTGAMVTEIHVSYTIWYRNDQPRATALNLSYAADDAAYAALPEVDFTTPEEADAFPAWTSVVRSTTIGGLALADGAALYLKWSSADASAAGSRDELGIDDVAIRVGGPNAIRVSSFQAGTADYSLLAGLMAVALAGAAAVWHRLRLAWG